MLLFRRVRSGGFNRARSVFVRVEIGKVQFFGIKGRTRPEPNLGEIRQVDRNLVAACFQAEVGPNVETSLECFPPSEKFSGEFPRLPSTRRADEKQLNGVNRLFKVERHSFARYGG